MPLYIILMLFIYTFACLFLILVILLQSGDKGGGLSSLGGASQGLSDALGATGAERTFNKVTTICACTFIILAVALSFFIGRQARQGTQILPNQPAPSQPLTDESGMQPAGQTAAGAAQGAASPILPTDGAGALGGDQEGGPIQVFPQAGGGSVGVQSNGIQIRSGGEPPPPAAPAGAAPAPQTPPEAPASQ